MDLETLKDLNSFLLAKGYHLELTADGSPTLRWEQGESMHHSAGAASESIYIYQKALDFFLKLQNENQNQNQNPLEKQNELQNENQFPEGGQISVLSLGFGLGYNELLVSLWALVNGIPLSGIRLISFEKDSFLYEEFQNWLYDSEDAKMKAVYDLLLCKIIEFNSDIIVEKNYITFEAVKNNLKQWSLLNHWQKKPTLDRANQINDQFNIFLFDAFSKKTTPHLWEPDFLDELFKNKTKTPCVFSTYACRGDLKRSLLANNFRITKRQGFKGKREATLAFKDS